MTDANWWNNYFTLTNTRSGTHAAEQDSEEYRLLRYAEITESLGVWECKDGQSDSCGVGLVVLLLLLFFLFLFKSLHIDTASAGDHIFVLLFVLIPFHILCSNYLSWLF